MFNPSCIAGLIMFAFVLLQSTEQVFGKPNSVTSFEDEIEKLKIATVLSGGVHETAATPEFQTSGATAAVVTVVKSADDLTTALNNGAEHIEIQEHLDLTLWSWRNESEYLSVFEVPEFVRSLKGNCEKPFPTASSLGVQPFKPPLPKKTSNQCMVLVDGSSMTSALTGEPKYDIHFSISNLQCPKEGECSSDANKAEWDSADQSYPIWVDKLLFHSLNPTTFNTFRIQRNAVLTNVTVAGIQGKDKYAIFSGLGGSVHVEDSTISGFQTSRNLVLHIGSSGSYKDCIVTRNSQTGEENGVIYAFGSKFSPVMLNGVSFKGNIKYDNLLYDGWADCCNSEPTFFSDEDRIVTLEYSDEAPFGAPTTTSTAPLKDAPSTKFISLQSAPVRQTIQDVAAATRESANGTFLYEVDEARSGEVAPQPVAVDITPRNPAPNVTSDGPNDDAKDSDDTDGDGDDNDPPPKDKNIGVIAGAGAGAGVLLLGVGALVGWYCVRAKNKQDSKARGMDEKHPQSERGFSYRAPSSFASQGPTNYPSSMRNDSYMETASMHSYSNYERGGSIHKAPYHGDTYATQSSMSDGARASHQAAVHGIASKPFDTLDAHTFTSKSVISEKPQKDAPRHQWQEYLESQLNSLIGKVVLQSVTILGGPGTRLHGGQAIVQLAEDRGTRDQLALKFFLSERAFTLEKNLYMDPSNPLGKFLPQLFDIVEGDKVLLDAEGNPLPQCIVMEKGESLDTWAEASGFKLDMFTGLQVLSHISDRLKDLHEAGYVHRDLKPGNVMWLPRKKRWTLIDFGCAAKVGEFARTGFSLFYAAPEAIAAYNSEEKGVMATEGLDAWSLGVLAIEMFTGEQPFDVLQDQNVTMDMIMGSKSAPWEDPETAPAITKKLGHLRKPVMGLLERDPTKRLSVLDFRSACRRMISNTTIGS